MPHCEFEGCKEMLADIVASYSNKRFGKHLCYKHQAVEMKRIAYIKANAWPDSKKEDYMDTVQDQEQKWGEKS